MYSVYKQVCKRRNNNAVPPPVADFFKCSGAGQMNFKKSPVTECTIHGNFYFHYFWTDLRMEVTVMMVLVSVFISPAAVGVTLEVCKSPMSTGDAHRKPNIFITNLKYEKENNFFYSSFGFKSTTDNAVKARQSFISVISGKCLIVSQLGLNWPICFNAQEINVYINL